MNIIRKTLFELSQTLTRRNKQLSILLVDVFLAPASFLLTCLVTYSSPWPIGHMDRLDLLFPVLAVLGGLASLGLRLTRVKLKSYEAFGATGLLPYSGLMGLSLLFLTSLPGLHFPTVGVLAFTLILFLATIGSRLLMLRIYMIGLRYGKQPVRVMIYGAGTTGLRLASALKGHETIKLVAFLDDDRSLHDQRLAGLRILPTERLEDTIRNYEIQRIILAMPSASAPKQQRLGRQLQAMGVQVQLVPSFEHLLGPELRGDALQSINAGAFLNRAKLDASLPDGAESYRGKVVMVTGSGGSVGSELCRQLIHHRPRMLVLFELSELALYTIERELRERLEHSETEIVAVLGSATDARSVRQAMRGHSVDVVIHAAAYKHVPLVEANPLAGLINNVFGTRTVADACVETGVKRFILVSTDKAVRPTNVMGASKRLAELVLQDLAKRHTATQFSIVRFGNVLGSSGSVIPLFKKQIAQGGPVTLTHEDVTRYFMTISEAARLVLLAGSFQDESNRGHAHVYVLDMGKPIRIRDLAEQLIQAADYTIRSEQNPGGDIEICVIGLRPGEKLHEELLIGDGLLTTPHPKILRALEEGTSTLEISLLLQRLGRYATTGDSEAARHLALEVALRSGTVDRNAQVVAAP